MKIFTKSLLTLALLVGAVGMANAGSTDLKDLPTANGGADAWKTAMASLTYPLEVKDVVLFGSDAGSAQTSADISTYDYIYIEVVDFVAERPLRLFFWDTANSALKLLFFKPVADKATADFTANTPITANGTYCVKVPEGCTLQGAKTPWTQSPASDPYFKISQFYLTESADPLANQKSLLSKAITLGKMQNPSFKTSISWSALQNAISAGEATKDKAGVTEEELTAATTAINNAIDNLVLFEGYTKLTKAMFKKYDSVSEPGEGTDTGCAYDINVDTGMPYGDGNVGELNWADLAAYDKLVVITSAGTPRIMLNRIEAGGNIGATKAESKMIEINQNSWSAQFPWAAEAYQTKDESGKIFTIDLKKIVDDWGFARLHSIKGANGNVTVTDLLLFKAPASTTDDPAVAVNLISLQNAIDKANEIDLSTKTRESAKKVKDALAVANDLMAQSAPSLEAIEIARRAILQAIDELVDAPVLADGVYDLTQAMFQEWTGIDEDAEPTEATIGCAYEVGTGEKGAGTTMFGNPSVVWKTYADLSAYDHLLIVGTPGLQLRVLFNRLEVGNGGGDGNGGALTELNPTIGEDGLVDVDLKAENLNGAARLNAIKLGWGSPAGQFTKLQVVKGAYDPVAVGLQTVKAAVEGEAIYSISGQRLAKPVKGLNIINGKVVVIK